MKDWSDKDVISGRERCHEQRSEAHDWLTRHRRLFYFCRPTSCPTFLRRLKGCVSTTASTQRIELGLFETVKITGILSVREFDESCNLMPAINLDVIM